MFSSIQEVTRRAFSALREIRLKGHIPSRLFQDFFMKSDQKNGQSSESLNSFDMGPIFLDSLGLELSRGVSVVSVYAFERKIGRCKDFSMTPTSRDFHENLTFLETV